MFAIIQTGGKQYKVAKDNRIKVEKLDLPQGNKIILDQVLFIENEKGETIFGNPIIKNAVVEAEILRNYKDKKIIVFKKKRRQNYRRKKGHRQNKTELKILNININ